MKNTCMICKIVGIIVTIGAINWGLIGAFSFNLVGAVLGAGFLARLVYIVVGLAGLMMLASFFMECPACKKE